MLPSGPLWTLSREDLLRLDLESKMALLKEEFLEKQDITASTLLV